MGRFVLFSKITVFAVLLVGLLAPLPKLAAYDPLNRACEQGGGAGSAVCNRTGEDPISGPNGVLVRAVNIVSFIAGIAAVIFLILGGIKYITSNGAPAEVSKAKETVIYSLVGIVVIALSRVIIGFVIGRL